jgi:large subunit ribosomal protein L6
MFISGEMYIKTLPIPPEVKIEVINNEVKVSGPKGELKRKFELPPNIKIELSENKLKVYSESERRKIKALVGTVVAHVRNMIKGVTKGFVYKLKICFAHFPIRVEVKGNEVLIHNFLGEKKPRVAEIVGNVEVKVDKLDVIVSGIDVEAVGNTATNIEQACRIVGYDRRRFPDGIFLYSKE